MVLFCFLHVATAQVHMPAKPPGRGAVGILPGVVTPKHLLSPSATHHKLLNLRHNTWNGKQSKGLWGRRSEPEALKCLVLEGKCLGAHVTIEAPNNEHSTSV